MKFQVACVHVHTEDKNEDLHHPYGNPDRVDAFPVCRSSGKEEKPPVTCTLEELNLLLEFHTMLLFA